MGAIASATGGVTSKPTEPRPRLRGFGGTLGRVGFSPTGIVVVALAIAASYVPPFNREDLLRIWAGAALAGALAIAFDFTAGFINVANFGFAAFVGVGAYTSGLLAAREGLTPWIGMFVGAALASFAGFLTGALTLRLRGIYGAVMAWFVGLSLMGLASNWTGLTRGSLGLNVPNLVSSSSNRPYFLIAFGMLLITYVVCRLITGSRIGLAFRAIGQNIEAARASGVRPTRYRVLNFTISCAFAGWLGGFYAHYYGILTPDLMNTSHTVTILAIAYIGGRGSLWGGAVVAFPMTYLTQWLSQNLTAYPGLDLVIYGILLIVITTYYPSGVAGLHRQLRNRAGVALRMNQK